MEEYGDEEEFEEEEEFEDEEIAEDEEFADDGERRRNLSPVRINQLEIQKHLHGDHRRWLQKSKKELKLEEYKKEREKIANATESELRIMDYQAAV